MSTKVIPPIVLLVLLSYVRVLGQNQLPKTSGRSDAMAGIQSPLADVWSTIGNPAALSQLKSFGLGVFFENKFGLQELSGQSLVVAQPTSFGTIGVNASHFGFSLYSEAMFGLAFGRELVPEYLSMGMQVNFFQMSLGAELGHKNALLFGFGVFCRPIENLCLGLQFDNPFPQPTSVDNISETASVVQLGASYCFEPNIVLALEANKEIALPKTDYRLGMEFDFQKQFTLRVGMGSYPFRQTFGLGFKQAKFKIDLAFARNDILGYSPSCSIQYLR